MSGLFGTLNISKSGLFSQQSAIDTTSHNISNANTEGYSRQKVSLVTTRPYSTGISGAGQLGTGVQVDGINRIRDSFLDYNTRVELGIQGKYTGRDEFLSQVENVTNGTSDTGLTSLLGSFYDSWQQLSKQAETSSTKTVVAQQSLALTNELNHTYTEMQQLKVNTQSTIKDTVFDLNSTLEQVSKLNQEIIAVKIAGQEPNDLMDRRDLLLDQLSSKFGIKIDKENFHGIEVTTDENPQDPNAMYGGAAPVNCKVIQSVNPDQECRFSFVTSIVQTATPGNYTVTYYKNGDTSNDNNKVSFNVNLTADQYKTLDESRVLWADNSGTALNVDTSIVPAGSLNGLVNDGDTVNFSNLKLFRPPSGELNGYMSVQKDIDGYTDELNKLAKSIAFSVNAIMTQSTTYSADGAYPDNKAYNFFVNSDDATAEDAINAGNITVNKAIIKDSTLIQAGVSNTSGESDGKRALAVAGLRNMKLMIQGVTDTSGRSDLVASMSPDSNLGDILNIVNSANGTTLDNYFKETVDRIGIQEQEAKRMVKNQETLLAGFEQSKASVSGVSLDEEMANLIQYQHAYQANAKVISTVDELLDVVINGLKK